MGEQFRTGPSVEATTPKFAAIAKYRERSSATGCCCCRAGGGIGVYVCIYLCAHAALTGVRSTPSFLLIPRASHLVEPERHPRRASRLPGSRSVDCEEENERPVNRRNNARDVRGEECAFHESGAYTISAVRTKRARVGEVRKGVGGREEEAEDEDEEGEWKEKIKRERERDPGGNVPRLQSSGAGPLIKGENEFLEEGGGLRSAIDSLAASYRGRSRYRKADAPLKLLVEGTRGEPITTREPIPPDLRDGLRVNGNIKKKKHWNLKRTIRWFAMSFGSFDGNNL